MKSFSRLIALAALAAFLCSSCALLGIETLPEGYTKKAITDEDEQIEILYTHYPDFYAYFAEGVLKIMGMDEVTDTEGEITYNLDYKFVKRRITNESEIMFILRDRFPKLYQDVRKETIVVKKITATAGENGRINYDVDYKLAK